MKKPDRREPHETAGVERPIGGVTASRPEKGRSRDWEERQRNASDRCVLTFRYQPTWIRERINEIAEDKMVIRDEVVRTLLEYALAEYKKGKVPMQAVLKKGKLTLFPEEKD